MMGRHELVEQHGLAPTAKVLAGWVTGGGATLVLAIVATASDAIPADTAWGGLVVAVLAGAASWLKKARRTDR